jgi:hypothetical protein
MSAVLLTACWPLNPLDDCEQNAALTCFWERFAPTSSSGAGGDGGTPPGCVPSDENQTVADGCGVFVSSSLAKDDSGDGSQAKPFKTLTAAVEQAGGKGKPVYACAEEFVGSVRLASGIAIYGGLDCEDGWTYVGTATKSVLVGDVDEVALTIAKSAGGAEVVDFRIQGVDATTPGGSSIAVLVDGVTAGLVRCELHAGVGAKGTDGMHGDPNGMAAAGGAPGNAGKDACSDLDGTPGPDPTVAGGALVTNDCAGGELSIGGKGGDGNIPIGGDGSAGQSGGAGKAGTGEPSMGMWDCVVGSGQSGSSGEVGMAGAGASGGSGGAGGCGALPGQGGRPGGASIALVSLNASITLTDCTLSSSKGGDGGAGGDRQPGGAGGLSGLGGQGVGGSNPGCSGGQGGKGGNGGPGGGGLGGPSLGIAFRGEAPQGEPAVTLDAPGKGGPGGSADVGVNAGEAGVAAEQREMP